MNELRVFNYQSNEVRTVEVNGEPHFVLKDVCAVLGIVDHKVTARRLDGDEVCQIPLIDSMGRNQETTVINESGLYSVILRSDKPEAKPFRKWVTSEVLPSIRKTGGYGNPQFSSLSPQTQALINMELRQNKIEAEQREQKQTVADLSEDQQKTKAVVLSALSSFAAPPTDEERWRTETNRRIRAMCEEYALNYHATIGDMYAELERRARVNLATRQKNLRERMRLGGAKYAQREAVSKLVVISQDTKLRYIYEAIVREKAAQLAASRLPA